MSKRSRSSIKNYFQKQDSNETISLKRGKPNSPSTVSNNSKMQSQQLTEFDYRYLKDSEEIASASCELLNCIRDLQSTEPVPICFDIQCEYNAESKKFGKTSVIQLCHDPSICFVFHVSDLESLPAEFLELLESTSVLLVGNSIKNNLNQLKNDFDELTVDDILEQCCDLGELANNVLNTGRQYTLATLLDILCKKTLNHNPNIRLSDWNTIPLSAAQKNYAATSVYMTHLIYAELKCIEMKSSNGILPMEINNENEPSLMNTAVLEEKTEKPVRRSTRSNTKIASPPRTRIVPEHVELPFIEYKGSIKYYTTMHDIASASDELLQWVNLQTDSVVPIAFDMEWPFSFQTGPGKSAVIQLCADVNVCYIFHLTDLKKLPAVLVALLNHDKVVCHGVNIKNDFRKLERDFTEVKVQKMIDQCLDLGVWCNSVLDTSGRWSMERLVRQICKLQISKDGKVRRSKWNVMPLTEPQQIYAAIDVYIAQVMYYKLKDIENKKLERLEEEREMRMAA